MMTYLERRKLKDMERMLIQLMPRSMMSKQKRKFKMISRTMPKRNKSKKKIGYWKWMSKALVCWMMTNTITTSQI
jgi:hypothetical protein